MCCCSQHPTKQEQTQHIYEACAASIVQRLRYFISLLLCIAHVLEGLCSCCWRRAVGSAQSWLRVTAARGLRRMPHILQCISEQYAPPPEVKMENGHIDYGDAPPPQSAQLMTAIIAVLLQHGRLRYSRRYVMQKLFVESRTPSESTWRAERWCWADAACCGCDTN